MVLVRAKLSGLRMSPRKVRLVANLIKGMQLADAEIQLRFLAKRAGVALLKLLRSAKANAANQGFSDDILQVKDVRVDEGKALRRFRKRAPGGIKRITKRASHIEVVLETTQERRRQLFQPKQESAPAPESPKVAKEEMKPKVAPPREERKTIVRKGRDFVQRVFRRKAI